MKPHRIALPEFPAFTQAATVRNRFLGFSSTLGFLATIVVFDLGCSSAPTASSEPVATVTVTGPAVVVVGRTIQLTATTYKAAGLEVTGKAVSWSSFPETVATVSNTGLVTGVSAGEATITATSEGKSGSLLVTVSPVPVATVTVTGQASVLVRRTTHLAATLKDADGNVLTGRTVTWTSQSFPPGVASVSTDGLVTGVEPGQATITATSEGQSGSLQVTVAPQPVATVTVTGPASVPVNGTGQFFAELLDADGQLLFERTVTWSSAPSTRAIVTNTGGLVTGVSTGLATVIATSEGKSGFLDFEVTPAVPDIQVTGRVLDGATGLGIAGATIDFTATGGGSGTTATSADGSFSLLVTDYGLPLGLDVRATKTGYVSTTLSAAVRGPSTQLENILLVQATAAKGTITGTLRNARTGQGIQNARVDLHRDMGNFLNEPVMFSTTNAIGGFSFSELDAGTYSLRASPPGFRTGTRTAITVVSGGVVAQDLVLTPSGDNLITIVLTWGASPSDLDSHLTGPNADPTRFHVSFLNRGSLTAPPFAALDVDDVSSFGPETITITQFNSGVYRYSVHDFTNRNSASSAALGASGAKVELYHPQGTRTFFVPNQSGTLWTVFELSGDITDPTITERNEMGVSNNPGGILSPPNDGSPGGTTDAVLIGGAVEQAPAAKSP